MAARDFIFVTGDKQVDNMLRTLEPKLKRKAIRKGTRAGAKVVLAEARNRVPVDEGNLLRKMKVRTAKKDSRAKVPFKRGDIGHAVTHVGKEVGRGTDDPFYSFFVQYGTIYQDAQRYITGALYDKKHAVRQESVKAINAGVEEIAAKERTKIRV